jgi:hypothetical protein
MRSEDLDKASPKLSSEGVDMASPKLKSDDIDKASPKRDATSGQKNLIYQDAFEEGGAVRGLTF